MKIIRKQNALVKMKRAAMKLARYGFYVFAVHTVRHRICSCGNRHCKNAGKHPRTRHGVKDATQNIGKIRDWWDRWPDANIGVATGAAFDLTVVDNDPRTGGIESLKKLESKYGALPDTKRAYSGGEDGGTHSYFSYPPVRIKSQSLTKVGFPGLEIKADGGYVIAPPSLHQSGRRYKWDRHCHPDKVQMPKHLVDLLASRDKHRPLVAQRLDTAGILQGVPEGERDDSLFRLACKLRQADVPRATADELILGAAAKCVPQFPAHEALKKVDEAYNRYPPGNVSSFNASLSSLGEPHPPWPGPLSPSALQGLAGEFVKTVAPHTEADPAALLLQLLCGFGNVVGRQPCFLVESDFHHTNLFVMLVGETSKGRKGTSLAYIKQALASSDFGWKQDRIQEGLSTGEGLIHAVRDPLYQAQPVKKAGRVVEYQSVMVDEGVEDKRLLVVETEFSSTLKVMGRHGNTLSPTMRQGWDTGHLRTLTKNSPEKATDAHISIIAHTTREDLLRYLEETETSNGYANRFLLACVRRSNCLPRGGKTDQSKLQTLHARLASAVAYAQSAGELDFDQKADRLWAAVYPRLSEGRPGLFGAVTARAEAQVVRLSCIYALLDKSRVIRREHLQAALAVWDYCEQSARWTFGESVGNPMADRILSELRANPAGLTRTEVNLMFNRNRPASEIDQALQTLEHCGLATMQHIETKGRPKEQWKCAPQYHEINEIDELSPDNAASPEKTLSKKHCRVDMELMRKLAQQAQEEEYRHGSPHREPLAVRGRGVRAVK